MSVLYLRLNSSQKARKKGDTAHLLPIGWKIENRVENMFSSFLLDFLFRERRRVRKRRNEFDGNDASGKAI